MVKFEDLRVGQIVRYHNPNPSVGYARELIGIIKRIESNFYVYIEPTIVIEGDFNVGVLSKFNANIENFLYHYDNDSKLQLW